MIVCVPSKVVSAIITAGDRIYAPDRITPIESKKLWQATRGVLAKEGPQRARDFAFNFMYLRSKWGRVDREGRLL